MAIGGLGPGWQSHTRALKERIQEKKSHKNTWLKPKPDPGSTPKPASTPGESTGASSIGALVGKKIDLMA